MKTLRQQFLAGVKAELPILIGVIPFGMIYGVLALRAGIPPGAAQAMSSIVFAGSSQFVTTQLVSVHTPGFVIILTIGIINLRHALYSASIAPYMKRLSNSWKFLLAYLLTDEAYAVSIVHYEKNRSPSANDGSSAIDLNAQHWFFLGAGLALWSSWQASTAVGILLGAVIPPAWALDFALPLTFIALVMPLLDNRASQVAALVAGSVILLTNSLPYKIGLILAVLIGIAAGLGVERRA